MTAIAIVVGGVTLAACRGAIGDPGEPFGPGGSDPSGDCRECACDLPPARVWAISPRQYERAILELVPTAPTAAGLASLIDVSHRRFHNEADHRDLSSPYYAALFSHTEQAASLVADDPSLLDACLVTAFDDACLTRAFTSLIERAWRRVPTAEEVARFSSHVREQRAVVGDDRALADGVQAVLLSPSFLFRTELGAPTSTDAVVSLEPAEQADALAFFLLDGAPDAPLLADARSGALAEPGMLAEHARRILAAPDGASGLLRFFAEYTEAYLITQTEEDGLGPSLAEDMATEFDVYVSHVLAEDGRLETLMTAPYSYLSPALAEHYGVTAPAEAWGRVELPPTERAGLLTLGAVLTPPLTPEPIYRGKMLRQRILCDVIAAPDMVPPFVPPDPATSTETRREALARHTAAPYCMGCHRYMNPLGFPFERYDALGRFRLTEGVHEIDSSGELIRVSPGSAPDVAVADAIELAHVLATDRAVRECFVRSLFQYAYGRPPSPADTCEIERLSTGFEATEGDVIELVADMVGSAHFTMRRRN